MGTPAYMSPEQAGASERIDGRSDIYCPGLRGLRDARGRSAPTWARHPRAILAKHLQAPVPDLTILRPGLSPAAQTTMRRALAKVPAERFSKATEFVDALAADAKDEEPSRFGGSAARRIGKGVGVVALVAIIVFAAWRFIPPFRHSAIPPATSPPALERIAVLYFDNLSSDPEVGLIAQGLTEDVIDELSQSSRACRSFRRTECGSIAITRPRWTASRRCWAWGL